MHYALLDSGEGRKWERFGPFSLVRPCSQAVWKSRLPSIDWGKADATFLREGDVKWTFKNPLCQQPWEIEVSKIRFKINLTDFGHLGIFPEQAPFWSWMQEHLSAERRKEPIQVLNLFAYSGGSTLAAALAGASVCHLDASKGMVSWARENALLNNLEKAPIRWIVDDVRKFLMREIKRGKRYDAIILDPPTFGRGNQGEIFKIEEHIGELLVHCRALLSAAPLFVLFTCHTPGFTPIVLQQLLQQMMQGIKGEITTGEMLLEHSSSNSLPSGAFARWSAL